MIERLPRMKNFFISYTGADQQWAEWIAWQLEEEGYDVVLQAWDFPAGGNFVLLMQKALEEAERTIAVLSPRYLTSLYAMAEWAAAFTSDPTGTESALIPVRIEPCELKGLHSPIITTDLFGLNKLAAKNRLQQKIREVVRKKRGKPENEPPFPVASEGDKKREPRFPGTLPEVCNLPRRNANFMGRESILEALRTALQSGHKTAITQQAIFGLGGIGKTQLALEYAWRHSSAYDIVWLLRAEDASTLASDYAMLATKLNLPEKDAQDQTIVIEAVKEWLDHNSGWLIIFDNAKNFEAINHYLPTAPSGHALITSRNQNWNNNFCTPLEIKVWSRDESIAFLQKRTGQSDDKSTDALAKTLGDLPLALEQAAAFCSARQKSCANYLDLFATRREELWKREKHPDNYPDTVATTWSLSFEAVERVPWATDILKLCALVAPDAIPHTLITKALERYTENKGSVETIDIMQIDDALEALRTYSLVTQEKEQLFIHRLVQSIVQNRMNSNEKEHYRESCIMVLSQHFPNDGYSNPAHWSDCAKLMPHAEAIINAVPDDKMGAGKELGVLLHKVGNYFHGRAAYAEAESFTRRAFIIREKVLGVEHPDVAASLNNLAELLRKQGKYIEAERLHQRALAIFEKSHGQVHPDVADSLDNFALVLSHNGKNADAEIHYRRALAIREKLFGPNHLDVADSRHNLAMWYFKQRNYDEAERLNRLALAIREKLLDSDHLNVAITLNNLAIVLVTQKNYTEAESHHLRALTIREKSLGLNHPDVANSLNNLADLLSINGNFCEAEPLYRRALTICEKSLGIDHPESINVRDSLHALIKKLNKQ
jgi:tetratricopeptide (TPR) repeat protein